VSWEAHVALTPAFATVSQVAAPGAVIPAQHARSIEQLVSEPVPVEPHAPVVVYSRRASVQVASDPVPAMVKHDPS
jgi:hypothetical protein